MGLRETMNAMFSSPGQRAAWTLIKGRFNPPFRAYIDGFVARAAAVAAVGPAVLPSPNVKRPSKVNPRRQR